MSGSLGLLLGEAATDWLPPPPPPAPAAPSPAAAPLGELLPPFRAASFARSALSRSLPIIGPLLLGSLFSSCCASPRFRACTRQHAQRITTEHHAFLIQTNDIPHLARLISMHRSPQQHTAHLDSPLY